MDLDDFRLRSKAVWDAMAAGWETALQAEVRRLLEPFFDARENPRGKKIRLIGVRVEKLVREDAQGAAPPAIVLEAAERA
jgi:hypothetical protein